MTLLVSVIILITLLVSVKMFITKNVLLLLALSTSVMAIIVHLMTLVGELASPAIIKTMNFLKASLKRQKVLTFNMKV